MRVVICGQQEMELMSLLFTLIVIFFPQIVDGLCDFC